jgi:tRNA G18 (ribose-2'-O)-methylase SpoU
VLLAQLNMAKVRIYAASSARVDGRAAADLREGAAIFVGNESSGVPVEVERAADAVISIPMAGTVESLNA